MKRQKISIKKRIEKKIEYRNRELGFIGVQNKGTNEEAIIKQQAFEKNKRKQMDELDRLRIYGDGKKPINVALMSRDEMRMGVKPSGNISRVPYQKKAFVDYDVVICIPSYNRYKKVRRLITQFYEQPTKYTFKIILLNDGSSDIQYDELCKLFPEIIYLKNEKPNGKILHWYCYNQMWEHLKNIECHTVLQMDDDFIISKNFLNTIIDMFFEIKQNNPNWMAITPHLWSFKKISKHESWWGRNDFVDGIALIDDVIIKHMDYKMKPVDAVAVSKAGVPVRAWNQIRDAIVEIKGIIYRTGNSLVYHDGNDDSKLHGDVRKNGFGGVYTQKYIEKL